MAIETRTPPHAAIPTAQESLPPGPAVPHPRGTGESLEARARAAFEDDEGGPEASPRLARRAWEGGMEAWENGARHSRQWARRHPMQLWGAVGALGLFAVWMAYRPAANAIRAASFDPSPYRWRPAPGEPEGTGAAAGARDRADALTP